MATDQQNRKEDTQTSQSFQMINIKSDLTLLEFLKLYSNM